MESIEGRGRAELFDKHEVQRRCGTGLGGGA